MKLRASSLQGREMAERLEADSKNLSVSKVEDWSVFAKMSQVTKVILGAHSVLADGGFIGPSGVYSLALTARYYSVPVYDSLNVSTFPFSSNA